MSCAICKTNDLFMEGNTTPLGDMCSSCTYKSIEKLVKLKEENKKLKKELRIVKSKLDRYELREAIEQDWEKVKKSIQDKVEKE